MADPSSWVSDIAFEGAATADGRYILPDALTWREPPLTLMAMTETGPGGHEGAYVAGRMDSFSKDVHQDMGGEPLPDGVTAVRSSGVFDAEGENGAEIMRLIADETVRGISVDLAVEDWALRNPETGELTEQEWIEASAAASLAMGELQYAVRKGTILAATVCPTPAFADARIALAASAHRVIRLWAPFTLDAPALTASAAGLAPPAPPRTWFYTPEATSPTPLTVTKDGRVFGHMALWDSCHTGYPGQCIPPPRSPSGYTYFNLGEVECADGTRVAAGAITLEGLHADTSRPLSPGAVRAHYENTATVAAHVRAVDGRYGIWVAGALRANLSERHARDLMGAKPSGDWRQMRPGGPLEMLGVHAVNNPGYPVPRLAASALTPTGEKVSLEFADPDELLERRLRVLAARAEGGVDAMLDLAGV